jgi:hypothetical protein
MTAICAKETAGVDVDRSLRIAAVEVAVGGIPVIRATRTCIMKKVKARPANQTRRTAEARQPDRVLIPFSVRSHIQQTSQRI